MTKGSIFQYVKTALNAEIVINTGNDWIAKIKPNPELSGGLANPPKMKATAFVVASAILSNI